MTVNTYFKKLYQISFLEKSEVDAILSYVLNTNSAGLYIFDRAVTTDEKNKIEDFLEKREKGLPFAYLIGTKEFWDLQLKVNQHTLIPRPETELLVEWVLNQTTDDFNGKILDLGTGTGAIALSIAKHRVFAMVTAIDYSHECINVANENKERYRLANVRIKQSNWFENIQETDFDYIVSNPPYIEENDEHLKTLVNEPVTALTAKEGGLSDIKVIIHESKEYLVDNGWLLIEHGYNQKSHVQALFKQNCYVNVKTIKDLSQIPRITLGQWQNVAIKSQ